MADCTTLTDAIYPGLDVSRELRACHEQGLGDTVLLEDGAGFAVCHVGPGSEADTGTCFVKFAAARAAADFERLVAACERFTADVIGITMHRPDEPGYSRPDAYVIDDWR